MGATGSETSVSSRTVTGRGGDVFVEQLHDCGVRFVFANPSGTNGPVFDALIDRPGMHVILGLQEGLLTAMADGYAKASGRIPIVIIARPGFPNSLIHMYNAFRDRSHLVVVADQLDETSRGEFGIQEVDDLLRAAAPFTRWRWESRRGDQLAEDVRRAFKFTKTPPAGPVFLSIPHDLVYEESVTAEIIGQAYFEFNHDIRASQSEMDLVAREVMKAKSPLLYVGPEVHRHEAEQDAVELAEMMSLPVVQEPFGWNNAFPTDHPLYLGFWQDNMRYPQDVDLLINLGGRAPALPAGTRLVHVSQDVDSLGRNVATVLASTASPRLFVHDLRQALAARIGDRHKEELKRSRGAATMDFTEKLKASRLHAAQQRWDDVPISHERLGRELERHLDQRTCVVQLLDSGQIVLQQMTFGAGRKQVFSTNGQSLGWALAAALGVKLARGTDPVVALMGDGDFLFGGSQALWTAQRYQIPITVVILNNRSYDNERNRIWSRDSRQAELNRDMTSYLGDPDVRYGELAAAYDVEAELIAEPRELEGAIERAQAANRDGRSYLIDVLVSRRGLGAGSTWHPGYSLAPERTRKL